MNRNIFNLLKNLSDIKTQTEKDESEGFSDSNSNSNSPKLAPKQSVGIEVSIPQDIQIQDPQIINLLKGKDTQIQQLQNKLSFREAYISEITSGYHKDLQILRDQLIKKEAGEEIEYYQVQYFNSVDGIDNEISRMLNIKLTNLKDQFEQKTKDLLKSLEQLKEQNRDQNTLIYNLQTKQRHLDNPEFLIRRLFQLEQDPYRFWKLLQDFKGNQYWLDIFENQKAHYGINYREINKFLMASKAYEREFQYYKSAIEEQMISYTESTLNKIYELKNELNAKQNFIAQQKEQNEQELNNITEVLKLTYQENLEREKSIFINLYQLKHNQLQEQLANFDKKKMSYIVKIWRIISRFSNFFKTFGKDRVFIEKTDIISAFKDIILDSSLATQNQNDWKRSNDQLQCIVNKLNEDYNSLKIKYDILRTQVQNQESQGFKALQEHDELLEKCRQYKKEISQLKVERENQKRKMNAILQGLDRIQKKEDLEKKVSENEYFKKLQQLDQTQLRMKREVLEQCNRNEATYTIYLKNLPRKDQSTMTYIFNVKLELQEAITKAATLSQKEFDQILKPKSFETYQNVFVQTQFSIDDIKYLEYQVSQFNQKIDQMNNEIYEQLKQISNLENYIKSKDEKIVLLEETINKQNENKNMENEKKSQNETQENMEFGNGKKKRNFFKAHSRIYEDEKIQPIQLQTLKVKKLESERKFQEDKVSHLNWYPPLTESEETRMFLEAQLVLQEFKNSIQLKKKKEYQQIYHNNSNDRIKDDIKQNQTVTQKDFALVSRPEYFFKKHIQRRENRSFDKMQNRDIDQLFKNLREKKNRFFAPFKDKLSDSEVNKQNFSHYSDSLPSTKNPQATLSLSSQTPYNEYQQNRKRQFAKKQVIKKFQTVLQKQLDRVQIVTSYKKQL